MSQCELILRMLQERPYGVTPMDALLEAGSMRCAARISDLRAAGHDIETHIRKTASGKRVARYVLR